MWSSVLRRHFPFTHWKKHYTKISFYCMSVIIGLKPSFLWDFGPSVSPNVLSLFLKDLKENLNCANVIVIVVVGCDVFIANSNCCLQILENERFFISIRKGQCDLMKGDDTFQTMINCFKNKFSECTDLEIWQVSMDEVCCPPSLFGILLGYPIVYYFKNDYKPFPARLKVYSVTCLFTLKDANERLELFAFSVPQSVLNPDIDFFVSSWFKKLSVTDESIFSDLKLDWTWEDVNALIL